MTRPRPHFALRLAIILLAAAILAGCASNQPVIYSGPSGGDRAAIDAAIAECARQAEAAGATPYGGNVGNIAGDTVRGAAVGAAAGAVGGAIAGNAAQGAGIGAASSAAVTLVQRILMPPAPNPVYRNFVERCLSDKGFATVGWQ